jgi:hypothetical protein
MTDRQIQSEIAARGYDTETRTLMTDHAKQEGGIRLTKLFVDSGWLHTWQEALDFTATAPEGAAPGRSDG